MAEKILIVEDEAIIRKNIAEVLRMQGYQILEACNGVEAVDLLTNQRIDLLISDLIMPQVDGLQLVERVQAQSPKTPVMTATFPANQKPKVRLGWWKY